MRQSYDQALRYKKMITKINPLKKKNNSNMKIKTPSKNSKNYINFSENNHYKELYGFENENIKDFNDFTNKLSFVLTPNFKDYSNIQSKMYLKNSYMVY